MTARPAGSPVWLARPAYYGSQVRMVLCRDDGDETPGRPQGRIPGSGDYFMVIDQNKLREIITRIVKAYMAEGRIPDGALSASDSDNGRKNLFVYCEKGGNSSFVGFLKHIKGMPGLAVTAVLECPEEGLASSLKSEGLCDDVCAVECFDNGGEGYSVYPSFSRSALCEAALGMDREFASGALRRDFECGRKPIILSDGMDPFTGKEPDAYREMILKYIRSLIQMDVCFSRNAESAGKLLAEMGSVKSGAGSSASGAASRADSPKETHSEAKKAVKSQTLPKAPSPEQVLAASKKRFVLQTDSNLLKQSDFMDFPIGSTVYSPERKILTPLAKDALHIRQLRFINGRQATYTY